MRGKRSMNFTKKSHILLFILGLTVLVISPKHLVLTIQFKQFTPDASFIGEAASDRAGEKVAGAGDVNNDGYADILIGADSNDEGGSNAGKVYLILGRADVTQWNGSSPLDLNYANASFIGEEAGDNAGYALAGVGDVNNDGYADILIGASGNDEGGSSAGKVYLILGRADVNSWGDSSPLDLSYANASFIGEEAGDGVGWTLDRIGDVNNDGFADILIGADGNDEGGSNAGKAYLILGRADVTQWNGSSPLDLSYANASFIGEEADDGAGIGLAGVGDVNNDGFADILIGAAGNDEGGSYAGKAYLILGRVDVTQWNGSSPLDLNSANASFIGEEAGDRAGDYGVDGAGDVNKDGFDDILIGAYDNDEGGSNAGQTYLIFGRADVTHWNGSFPLDLSYANASFIGSEIGTRSGYSLAGAGDINKDGYDDILNGVFFFDNELGATYLNLGKPTGQWMKDVNLIASDAFFFGEEEYDSLGTSVASAGDVNNDEYDDFLTSADGNDEGSSNAGKTYLILGAAITGRLIIRIQQISVDYRTIEITFNVRNPQGNAIPNAQMEVSNQTQVWTGLTNATGHFKVSMAFTPLEFILEVQASGIHPYTPSTENFIIQIDLTGEELTTEIDNTTESTTSTTTTKATTTDGENSMLSTTTTTTTTTTTETGPGGLFYEALIILGLFLGRRRYSQRRSQK